MWVEGASWLLCPLVRWALSVKVAPLNWAPGAAWLLFTSRGASVPVWVTPSKKVGSRCVGPCRWAGRSRAWSGKRLEGPVGQVFPSSRAGEWGWLAPNQAPRPTGETVDQERRSPEAATRSVEQHSPPQLRTLQALAEERHQLQRAAARCLHHAIAPNSTSHGPLRPYTVYQPKWRRSSQPLTRPWLY